MNLTRLSKRSFILLMAIAAFFPAFAQNTIGFSGTVAAGSAPAGSGPSVSPQTVTLHQSQAVAAPPGVTFTPTTTVTFSLSNQQFTSIEGNPSVQGMEFGAFGNSGVGAAGNNATGTPFWAALGTIFGGTYTGDYTGCYSCTVGNSSTTATGDGVRYTTLGSIGLMLYTDAMIQSSGTAVPAITDVDANGQPNLTGSFYYGDLTLTFNRPVSNPVLHIADIGGRLNYNTNIGGVIANYVLGFTTDYKLTTPGLTLSKLSGTTSLSVSADSIWNNAALFGSPSSGESYAGQTRTSASGSVVIVGTNITTVTFRLKIRGDGGAIRNSTGTTGAAGAASLGNFVQWAVQGSFQPCHGTGGCTPAAGLSLVSGDYMQFAVGLQRPVNVSGNLFHDINAGNVNSSSAVAIPGGVYANLVDANGKVVASQLIPNTGGTAGQFLFAGVGEGDYTVSLSTTPGVQGTTKPAESMPAGWNNTGEFNGTPNTGNDGTVNGISTTFTVSATDVTNINFGVQRIPESAVNLQPQTGNPGGFNDHAVPAAAFQTSNVGVNPNTLDYDAGTVNSIRVTAFPANANSITINGTVYTNGGTCPPATVCTPWPVGGVTIPYTNGVGPNQAISVDPVEGNVDVVIPFVSIDNAGAEDPTPGSVTIPFRTISLTGVVFNDLNGNASSNGNPEGGEAVINGTNSGGGLTTGAVLYANLVDALNHVLATVPVLSDGTYTFPDVPQNTIGLSVQLTTNAGTFGATKPATAIPAGWVTTGENKNGQGGGADASANSEIPVTTLTTNITLQNFGIQQVPESAVHEEIIGVNPGGVVNTTVNPNWFLNSNVGVNPNTQDYNGGTVNSIRITAFPSNATSITINGISYTSGTWPGGGITVPAPGGVPSQVITVDPVDGVISVVIPFVSIDNAGAEDPTPGSVTLSYTGILPVQLVSFTARSGAGCTVQLSWKTATEDNLSYYTVEKSENGISFTALQTVMPSGSGSVYAVTDRQAITGTRYYRLRSTDRDGRIQLSSVISVANACKGLLLVYPNPAKEETKVEGIEPADLTSLQLFNTAGKLVFSQQSTGSPVVTVSLKHLPSGIYQLKVKSNQVNETIQLVKQ